MRVPWRVLVRVGDLGLPIVRTSVDHGTALELAGSGKADTGSLFAAIETALEMVKASAAAPHK